MGRTRGVGRGARSVGRGAWSAERGAESGERGARSGFCLCLVIDGYNFLYDRDFLMFSRIRVGLTCFFRHFPEGRVVTIFSCKRGGKLLTEVSEVSEVTEVAEVAEVAEVPVPMEVKPA